MTFCASGEPPTLPVPRKRYRLKGEDLDLLVPGGARAVASDRITVDGLPVGRMVREVPTRPEDSGWHFFAGSEDAGWLAIAGNTSVFALNTVANYDPDILPYLDTPAPCAFEKVPGTRTFRASSVAGP
jgi:hypothetical protein